MSPKGNNNDFEKRYLDSVDNGFKDLKDDIKELRGQVRSEAKTITKSVDAIDERVGKIENKVFPAQDETIKQLPPFWRDPQVIKLLTFIAVFFIIIAIIVAGLWGIALPKGLL
jgi:Mg2+ and Co2+ transporter CorA